MVPMRWDSLSSQEKDRLRQVAAQGVAWAVAGRSEAALEAPECTGTLSMPGASFVTLRLNGQLRGCMGSLEAWRPLFLDVLHNAYASACRDPRFDPVSDEECPLLQLSISVLTDPECMKIESEADLIAQLRVGVDGLILSARGRSATYLPSVWSQLPGPKVFVEELKRKAGWSRDFWSSDIVARRYRSIEF